MSVERGTFIISQEFDTADGDDTVTLRVEQDATCHSMTFDEDGSIDEWDVRYYLNDFQISDIDKTLYADKFRALESRVIDYGEFQSTD